MVVVPLHVAQAVVGYCRDMKSTSTRSPSLPVYSAVMAAPSAPAGGLKS